MSNPTTVTIDEPAERVLRITLDRPPVNALDRDTCAQLALAARRAATRTDVCCAVVAARGKVFCAGADLKERAGMTDDEVQAAVLGIREAVDAVAAIPVPTIAVLHGAALGGGFELALACDLRIAAEDVSVGLPECSLAIIPGAGGTQRLARLVGPARAKQWIFSARVARAREAIDDGLVDVIAGGDSLDETVFDLARTIARCGPVALRAAKRAIDGGLDAGSLAGGMRREWESYLEVLPTADRKEALAAFAEKRPPRFTGQ